MSQELPLLERSALVVAHPDDEILWFSSVVQRVDRLVMCFLDDPCNPISSAGRARVVAEYPRDQLVNLGMREAGVFDASDWRRPIPARSGVQLGRDMVGTEAERSYLDNFEKLCERLEDALRDCRNVITHNPWGEYGHEEHVQVYRAVKETQRKLGFDVWFSNYCSDRSFRLACSYIVGYRSDYVTIAIDRQFVAVVRDLYRRYNCWTWFEDFEWFNEESFLKDRGMEYRESGHGRYFPLNVVRMGPIGTAAQPGKREQLLRMLARMLGLPEPV